MNLVTHLGLWGLGNLGPLTRIHKVMGPGWLDSLHGPYPSQTVPGLPGTPPYRVLAGKLGSLPAQFSLASPETLLLVLTVQSQPPCTQINPLE